MLNKHFFRSTGVFFISGLILSYTPITSANIAFSNPPANCIFQGVHYEQLNFILIKAPISCPEPPPITLQVIQGNKDSADNVRIGNGSRGFYKNISMMSSNKFLPCQQKFEYRLVNNLNTVLILNGMRLIDAKTHIVMTAGTWVDNKECQGTFYSTPVLTDLD